MTSAYMDAACVKSSCNGLLLAESSSQFVLDAFPLISSRNTRLGTNETLDSKRALQMTRVPNRTSGVLPKFDLLDASLGVNPVATVPQLPARNRRALTAPSSSRASVPGKSSKLQQQFYAPDRTLRV